MRYLPHTANDRAEMLQAIGIKTLDDLYADVPQNVLLTQPVADLPNTQSEMMVERQMVALAAQNRAASAGPFFCGAGVYKHHVPAAVDHLIQRGEFLTSYTPYQPEVAQGTLQYLFEFQTQVALLTGMEIANASMYDGSTAAAEAVFMAQRVTKRSKVILSGGLHPHYASVIQTNATWTGFDAVQADVSANTPEDLAALLDDSIACVVVQNPNFFGGVADLTALSKTCQAKGALLIVVVTEVVSLGLLPSPGSMGADIVVCEGQSIGVPMSFGGPHVGLFAIKEKFLRQMPGRICGETVDADGKRGFVLTLSTREQHIRRDKATSNICTNAGLCALAFTIHLSLLGETGFKQLAALNHARAVQTAEAIEQAGFTIITQNFFNEFVVDTKQNAAALVERAAQNGVIAGVPLSRLYPHQKQFENYLLVAATECTSDEDITKLAEVLKL